MNNDLISRSRLLEAEKLLMTDIVKNDVVAKDILEQVLYDIENFPTALDNEKMVNRIKVLSAGILLNLNISSDYAEGYIQATKDIIKIIEGKWGMIK